MPTAASSSATGRSSTPTAIACSVTARRRGRPPGDTAARLARAAATVSAAFLLRNWLYRIATNVCLDALARRSPRVLPIDQSGASDPADHGKPLADGTWIEPYPDGEIDDGYAAPEARYEQREAVEPPSSRRFSTCRRGSAPC